MPHTFNQNILAEQMEEYSKALAEDCMISGTYDSACLYAKKETDNLYSISFVAYEPKKDKKQIIRSSTRIFSKIDKEKLINTITTVYKTFKTRTNPPAVSTSIVDNKIVIIFNIPGEWKIAIADLSIEEQESINAHLEKIS